MIESSRALLAQLYRSWTGQGPRLSHDDESAQIDRIGQTHDPSAVPALIGLLCRGGHLGAASANAIKQIIDTTGPSELARMDRVVRKMSDYQWTSLTAQNVLSVSHGMVAPLGLLSFTRDGRVREAAVRALADVSDGRELSFLLIRLNDWVRQVRDVAREAVAHRLRPDYALHFAACLPLVYQLRAQGRGDHRPVVDAVLEMLRDQHCRPALLATLSARDRQTRRLAFRLLLEAPAEDPRPMLFEALVTDDTVIRLRAARELRRRLDGQLLQETLKRLSTDRFMPVRREVLYGYAERLPEVAAAPLRAALLDSHPSIRETARFYLKDRAVPVPAIFYRDQLSAGAGLELAAAVAGLGETGERGDASLLASFLRHANPRVRRAAVRAVGRLEPERFIDELAAALCDPAASVAGAARDLIRLHPYLMSPEKLWSYFEHGDAPHTRRMTLDLIGRLAWWDSISLLIRAAAIGDDSIHQRAGEHVRRWMRVAGRYSARPTQDQVRRLEEAIALHPQVLTTRLAEELRQGLDWTKRAMM